MYQGVRVKGSSQMEVKVPLRIVLEGPPAGVDFGLQDGNGRSYETIQKQTSKGKDLGFDCTVTVKDGGQSCATVRPEKGWKCVTRSA